VPLSLVVDGDAKWSALEYCEVSTPRRRACQVVTTAKSSAGPHSEGGTHVVRRFVLPIALLVVLGIPYAAWAQPPNDLPPIMPLADIKPGMRGIGRTVVQGQKVEEFEFEVIGILSGGGGIIPVRHLILFRAFGPLTDRTGGTAAGMSGSPLYIGGKLIGALSAGYLYQPNKRELALGTPIEEMLAVLDLPTGAAPTPWPRTFTAYPPVNIGARRISRVIIANSEADAAALETRGSQETAAFVPAAFPAMVSGLSTRAVHLLQEVWGSARPLQQYEQSTDKFEAAPIVGGSSVGILQVRGDVNYGGMCTVTLRTGDKLLICGHPWDQLGDVEYALTTSNIITVVRTLQEPFKEGTLGELIGKIDQDRGAGIRGIVGRMPQMFAVRVAVTNLDTGKRIEKGMQVVRRRDLARVFAAAVTLTAVDTARDQVLGGGTAKVKITMRAKGLPRTVTRENIFYSSQDVSTAAVSDVPDALNFLFYNDLVSLEPIDMSVEIGLSSKRMTAAIVDAIAEHREVSPGGSLRVRLLLRPYRDEAVASRIVEIPIPFNYPRGPAVLLVGPAAKPATPPAQLGGGLAQSLQDEPAPTSASTLQEAIDHFEDFGKSTDVRIQLVPFGLPATGGEFVKFDVFAGDMVRTDWVVQGSTEIPIIVR
jgi:SpoIVB peptidase S55